MRIHVGRRLPAVAGLLLSAGTIGLVSASTAQAALPNFVWSGSDPGSSWTAGDNWDGAGTFPGVAPTTSGTIGTLSFPDLSSCDSGGSSLTCYTSTDDQGAFTADELSLDNSTQYQVTGAGGGDSLTLMGNGSNIGLDATPTANVGSFGFSDISLPVIIGANQSWNLNGGSYGNFTFVDYISGSSHTLGLNFAANAHLGTTDLNTGAVTLAGNGTLISETYNQNDASLPAAGITMNDGTGLWVESPNDTSGPIDANGTSNGNDLRVGTGAQPEAGLAVTGSLTLSSGSDVGMFIDGPSANQAASITASGNIALNGATLYLEQAADDASANSCTDLTHGETYTLISTSGGSITGSLRYDDIQGNRDTLNSGGSSTVDIPITTYDICQNASQASDYATATINYTSSAITVTIDSGGSVGDAPYESGSPTVTGTPQVGVPLQATDTWSGNPSYSYVWYSCTTADPYCNNVVGGSTSSYTPTASDQGNLISYCVQVTNAFGSGEDCSGNTTAVAAAAPPAASGGGTTTTPTPTPTTTPTSALPTPTQVTTALSGIAHPSGNKAIAAVIKSKSFETSFSSPSAGRLTVSWTTVVMTGKGKHKKHKTVTVATGSATARSSGKLGATIHLTAAGKALLKAKPHGLAISATEKFEPNGGAWTTVVRHFTL